MQVQRVAMPTSPVSSWTVLGDDDVPVKPIERFLGYLFRDGAVPEHDAGLRARLDGLLDVAVAVGPGWRKVCLEDIGEFIAWLRHRRRTEPAPWRCCPRSTRAPRSVRVHRSCRC
jgi:hypothetical protein